MRDYLTQRLRQEADALASATATRRDNARHLADAHLRLGIQAARLHTGQQVHLLPLPQ